VEGAAGPIDTAGKAEGHQKQPPTRRRKPLKKGTQQSHVSAVVGAS
jgi:hypothetical protein